MSVRRKLTSGVIGLGLLGIGGWVAFVSPAVGTTVEPLVTVVSPEAVTRTIVCTGDILGYEGDSAAVSPVDRAAIAKTEGDESTELQLGESTNGLVIVHQGESPLVAATESGWTRSETQAGYLATECGDPLNEQWLLGGSTLTGRDTILTISNGSDVEARVDLELWGAGGAIDAPGATGIVVPARSQRSYSIAGFAPDEPAPAIHLTSNGAAVWATLQTSAVRGLVPGGLDRVASIPEPVSLALIPLVVIPDEESIGAALVDPAYNDITTVLRILAPGETDATVSITLDPIAEGDSQVISATIPAGVVTDIPLSELNPGEWSISVESDQPLVAAARVGTHNPGTGMTDIAWVSSTPAATGIATLFSPTAGSIGLVNSTDAEATVTVDVAGLATEVTIPARGSISVPVSNGLVTVTSESDIAASMFLIARDGIASLRALTAPIDAANIAIIHG